MNPQYQILSKVNDILNTAFLPVGKTTVSVSMILYVLFLCILLIVVTERVRVWVEKDLLAKSTVDPGLKAVAGSLARFIFIFIGFIIILQTAGVDLSALTVVAGTLGLGISFGLQSLVTNVVSGIIIIMERPFKVGDRIEFDGTVGNVMMIGPRSTTIVTNDNVSIIVPNSELIKGKVTNWSSNENDVQHSVRFTFPVPADSKVVPEDVIRILTAIALENPGVLKEPKPEVVLQDLSDKSNNYLLRIYTKEFLARPSTLRSEINLAVHKAFREKKIAFASSEKNRAEKED